MHTKTFKLVVISSLFFIKGCSLWPVGDSPEAKKSSIFPWWSLSQGWHNYERQKFWFMDQGSRFIPYNWFLYLEQADNQELFRANNNIEKMNYIPAPASRRWNPDGLPIGLAKGHRDKAGVKWLGPTCAFCHTAKITINQIPVLVDGAPAQGDFETFNKGIIEALIAISSDNAKFRRFSANVLGDNDSSEERQHLKGEVQKLSQTLAQTYEQNKSKHAYGFSRLDAVGAIFNRVMAQFLDEPGNWTPSNAPVSYPFLWGTSQSTVVQWNGLAPNNKAGFGPLMRNVGEVLGVYGVVEVVNRSGHDYLKAEDSMEENLKKASKLGYKSSVNIENLGRIEKMIVKLKSPQWPKNLLPTPDPIKARRGEHLYQKNCNDCHKLVNRKDQKNSYEPTMVKVSIVGTDPTMADNFLMAKNIRNGKPWYSGKLEGTHAAIIAGSRYSAVMPTEKDGKPTSPRAEGLVTTGIGVLLGHPKETLLAAFNSYTGKRRSQNFNPRSYKARPLTGIWATAPYLHNGSVPNLFEVISDPVKRSKTFFVGSLEFDDKKVGYKNYRGEGAFLFDTRLPGNSNSGHDYGKHLTDSERYDLVEFLKTL